MWERAECILKQVATPHFWQRIGHHLVPLTLSDWRLATQRWSKFAKLRQQSVCSHLRGAGGRKWRGKKRGGGKQQQQQRVSCDFHPNLQFWEVINFAGCSYSKVFWVCVVRKLFFSPAYLGCFWAIWEIRIPQCWRPLCFIYSREAFLLSSDGMFAAV